MGDNGSAPDLRAVSVSDNRAGLITIRVEFTNMTSENWLELNLDTDRTDTTGDHGDDYSIDLIGGDPPGFAFYKWSGTEWVQIHAASLVIPYGDGFDKIVISNNDLGGTTAFDFWFVAGHGTAPFSPDRLDFAPDQGTWTYHLGEAVTPTLRIDGPLGVAKAHAGKPYQLVYTVASESGNSLFGSIGMSCRGTVGGKAVAGKVGLNARPTVGIATCYLKALPKKARGKMLKIFFSFTFEGVTTTKTFSIRVT
jgi:hypothetical protein